MNDQYMEAYDSIRSDERNGDRERAQEKQEAQHDENVETTYERKEREDKTLMELMMGEEFSNYFWDEKHAL